METPTVFVVPPHPALMCPIHNGVLDDPVTAPCGCTFCNRCIEEKLASLTVCPVNTTHNTPLTKDLLFANDDIAGRVSELLIHCRYGVRKDPDEGWVPCSAADSCKMWINLGNRAEHESKCPHKPCEDEFCIIEEDDLLEFKPDSDSDEMLEVSRGRSRSRSRSASPISRSSRSSSPARSLSSTPLSSRSSSPELIQASSDRSPSRSPSPPPRSRSLSPPRRSPSPPVYTAPVRVCPNKSNGCDFTCAEQSELVGHVIICERSYLKRQIEELSIKLVTKDAELAIVKRELNEARNALLETQASSSNVSNDPNNNNRKVTVASQSDFYVTLAKGLNKLEEESKLALEEAAVALKKTKAAIKESAGNVLNNIKKSFEEAHDEIVVKFNKLVKSLERDRPVESPAPEEPQQAPQVPSEDVELQQVLAASEASFKEESVLRAGDDELLNQALRLSLLETQQDNESDVTTDSDSDASSASGENENDLL